MNLLWQCRWAKTKRDRREAVEPRDVSEEFARLEEQAAKNGMRLAVDHVDGHWRAGFLTRNAVGEWVFALHATGPDEDTAVRGLARLVS